jgi:hypothetical protein
LQKTTRWSHSALSQNVNLELTLVPGQPPPQGNDAGDWPFASFSFQDAGWEEEVSEHNWAGAGLRHGLAVAFAKLVEWEDLVEQQVSRESEADVLITGIFCLQEMRRRFDEEMAWLIAEARYKGVSWAKIARALEMTRQAAHKRFSPMVEGILRYDVPGRRRLLEEMAQLDPPRSGSPPG